MVYRWIEKAMMLAAISPVVISFLDRYLEIARAVENAIRPFNTIIALVGVGGTIIALVVLVHSLQAQDKRHSEQILQMNIIHETHMKETCDQFFTKMSQIRSDDRENYLTRYMIAAANNIHYHRHLKVSRGFFIFTHHNENQDYFCTVLWNMEYKCILKMDENYVFDLCFKIYSIKELFGHSFNPTNVDDKMISNAVTNDLIYRPKNLPYWDLKFSIPRFEKEYGILSRDRDFSDMNGADIGQLNIYMFSCIAEAMGEVQVLEESKILKYDVVQIVWE